jgi:predicted metal-dependent TIM-barrel fold hydrolase
MIGPFIDIHGAVDVHVHSEPDLFPRIADDVGVARHAASLGLRALSLKCHSERTTSRAYLTEQLVPGIQVIGGIVLNRAVGGINPAAVQAALQLGAKHVWMPTVDAANHARTFGSTGAYDKQASTVADVGDTGIEVFDSERKPIDGLIDVLDLTAEHSAILSTCHLSVPEIELLVKTARERGVEKIMITHPFFKVPALDLETLKRLVAQGAYAEFGYCTVSPMWNHAPLTRIVDAIKELGPERCILMSDAGQRHNPMPAECLRVFAQSVHESGVEEEGVERMIKGNPLDLLELPPRREPVAAPVPTNGAAATAPGADRQPGQLTATPVE